MLRELLRSEATGAKRARRRRLGTGLATLLRDERGATMLLATIKAGILVGGLYYLSGVADAHLLRQQLQSGTDSGVFAEVALHARGLNFMALVNVVMGVLMGLLSLLQAVVDLLTLVSSVASFICGACCGPHCGAGCFACPVPPAVDPIKETVRGFKNSIEDTVEEIVRVTDKVNKVLAIAIPGSSSGAMVMRVQPKFAPTAGSAFTWPAFNRMPVRVLPLSELCQRGADEAASVMSLPVGALPVPGFFKDLARRIMSAFAMASAMRLCARIPIRSIPLPDIPDVLSFEHKIWNPVPVTVRVQISSEQVIQYVQSLFDADEAPMDVEEDAELGSEPFQVRTLVVGNRQRIDRQFRGVGLVPRVFGMRFVDEARLQRVRRLADMGRIALAQGESYFAGSADREQWLLKTDWRSRLRMFRPPTGSVFESAGQACRQWGGGALCSGIDGLVNQLASIAAH